MIKKVISFGICLSCLHVTALPVIIIDTGDWDGAIRATTHGFITYSGGTWVQVGANGGTQSIGWPPALWYTYRPAIRFTGVNTVTCNFNDIGWISASSGISAADEIEFETQNLVITNPVPVPILSEANVIIHAQQVVSSQPHDLYPSGGIFSLENGPFRAELSSLPLMAVGETISNILTVSAPLSFSGSTGIALTAATLILDFASRIVNSRAAISTIIYPKDFTSPMPPPIEGQTWRVVLKTTADLYHIKNVEFYDDDDEDGFVPDGKTRKVTLSFYKNYISGPVVEIFD